MNNHKKQYAKNTFTTSSDDDKINKENTGSTYPDFRKPVFRGNSKGVENRFHSAANIPAQSENKPYSYGIPMSREDISVTVVIRTTFFTYSFPPMLR